MEEILKHILLVDDSVTSLKQATALLHDAYKISMVKSGEQALAFLDKIQPDLILLDVEMPEMDGFETIRAIREHEEWKKIPVIFLTGNSDPATEVKCFEYGALDFITKPFAKEIAMHRIECQLELADYSHQLEAMVEERTRELFKVMGDRQRVSTELDLANDIQRSMLPATFPAFPDRDDFDIHACIETAKEVGGDFYNFRLLDDDHLMMVIADVVGKGIPAALFMVKTTTLIVACSRGLTSPAAIMGAVNDLICENNDEMFFTTAFVAVAELSTGKLSMCSAGHNPPVLLRKGETPVYMDCKPNMVLGAMGDMDFTEDVVQLSEGDAFFMFTDGIDEAMNAGEEQYGLTRLLSAMSEVDTDSDSAQDIIRKVREDVRRFVGEEEQSDDITMLSFIYRGSR